METSPIEESGRPERRSLRQHRLLRAQMISSDGITQEIIIRNISEKGMGGSLGNMIAKVGDRVTVCLTDDATVTGILRWVKGKSFGLQLDLAVNTTAFEHLITSKRTDPVADAGCELWEVSRFYRAYASHVPQADPNRLRRI